MASLTGNFGAARNGLVGGIGKGMAIGVPGPQGPQGPQGTPGYIPVRGKDYWTETDKSEILDDVLSSVIAIPIINSASGSVIQLTDSTDLKLRGLTIYGKTTQDGTPSPDNPVPLVSPGDSGSLTVITSGKNLIDPTDVLGFSNTIVSNGVVTQIDADTAPLEYVFKVQFLDSDNAFITQYVTYVPAKGRYGVPIEIPKNAALMLFGINGSLVDTMCSIPTSSFTVGAACTLSVLFTNITQGSVSWQDIQLELGSVATAYEPYKGSTRVLSTPNGLPGILVTSGGNCTDENGQQWICDEVDFARGVHVQRVLDVVFDGSDDESWVDDASADAPFGVGVGGMADCTNTDTQIVCNRYPTATISESWGN